jgi:hypothetical protein
MSEQTPTRPGTVTAAAVMLFIFGGLGLFSICGLLTPVMGDIMPKPPAGAFQDPMLKMGDEVPSFNAVQISLSVVGTLLAVFKIWAGMSCLNLRSNARLMTVLACAATVLMGVAYNIYFFVVVMPVYTTLLDAEAQKLPPAPFDVIGFTKGMMLAGLLVGMVFNFAIYLTIILLVNTQRARNAFAGIPDVSDYPEDEPRRRRDDRYDRRDDGYGSGYDDDNYPAAPPPKKPPETGISSGDPV